MIDHILGYENRYNLHSNLNIILQKQMIWMVDYQIRINVGWEFVFEVFVSVKKEINILAYKAGLFSKYYDYSIDVNFK